MLSSPGPQLQLWPETSPDPTRNLLAPPNETSTDEQYLAHQFMTWDGWEEWHRGWTPPEAREAVEVMLRGWPYLAASLARHLARSPFIFGAMVQRKAPPLRTTWAHEKSRGPQYVIEDLDDVWTRQFRPTYEEKLGDMAILGGSVIHIHWIDDVKAGVRRPVLKRWPHEAMFWRAASPAFPGGWWAITNDSGLVRMVPGDGHWLFLAHGERWHEQGAILPLGELFVADKLAGRDEAGLSEGAGRGSPIGELPLGVKITDEIGEAFAKMVAGLGRARTGAVTPNGGKVVPFQIESDTQFFNFYASRRLLQVALSILGQSATLTPGANGVYQPIISWSVADALAEKDHEATTRGWDKGLIRPFLDINAINSDAHLVGERYADRGAKAKADAERATLLANVIAVQTTVFDVKQTDVDAQAATYSTPTMTLKPKPPPPPPGAGGLGAIGSTPPNLAEKDVIKDETPDERPDERARS